MGPYKLIRLEGNPNLFFNVYMDGVVREVELKALGKGAGVAECEW